MKTTSKPITFITFAFMTLIILFAAPIPAKAHCDTMDGPVIKTAQAALDKGDITPVLKWVKADDENEIQSAFKKALAVRSKGPDAKEMADNYFFETLVRVHRAGEGAPYTGIRPAGSEVEPAIEMADQVLEKGSVDDLVKAVSAAVEKGIREHYVKTVETKKHADESVAAGREFVEAYVQYIHYVERIHNDAVTAVSHGDSYEGNMESIHQEHY